VVSRVGNEDILRGVHGNAPRGGQSQGGTQIQFGVGGLSAVSRVSRDPVTGDSRDFSVCIESENSVEAAAREIDV